MAVVKSKPTSAGRRHQVKVVTEGLHKGKPHGPLLEKKSKTGGRNNLGRITTRHIGGGHKQHYRKIDFKRTKDGIPAKVERIEYDPNRTAHIALLLYADGERRYIIAPKGIQAGDVLHSGSAAPIKAGNSVRGVRFLQRLVQHFRLHIFDTLVLGLDAAHGRKALRRAAAADPLDPAAGADQLCRACADDRATCAKCMEATPLPPPPSTEEAEAAAKASRGERRRERMAAAETVDHRAVVPSHRPHATRAR